MAKIKNEISSHGLRWPELVCGTLIKRYHRFLADVTLTGGQMVTAHCPNSGTMKACSQPGRPVYLSVHDNPKRKLKYTWEMINMPTSLVGVNTLVPNRLVKKSIEDYGLMNYVKMIQYIPHQEVVKAQQESSVLLLVINNTPNSQMILTGKFFEYLAARRSILCIGPEDGDAAEIIRETGFVSGFNDEAGLKKHILELFADFQNCLIFTGGSGIEKYSRKSLTGQLSQVLNEMILKSS